MPVVKMRNADGAAEGAAEIILPAGSPRSRVRLMRIQVLIGQTIENTAVILVGSRLCGEVVDPSLGLAELGGVVTGLQADFFQGFHRRLLVKEESGGVDIRAVLSVHQSLERARCRPVDRPSATG